MSGLGIGEILAVTSLVMQVVDSTDKVIKIWQKAQNAPSELGQLRISLLRMRRHFDMIREELRSSGISLIHKDDTDQIEDTLRCCKALLDDYDHARSRGAVLQAVWGIQHSEKLARYQDQINNHFMQILLPLWVATGTLVNSKARGPLVAPGAQSTAPSTYYNAQASSSAQPSSPTTKKVSVFPPNHISDLTQGIQMLIDAEHREDIEKTLQKLDGSLRKCWTELGLPVEGMFEITSPQCACSLPRSPY